MTLKMRARATFPPTVTASGGLKVAKANGVWTVSPDFSQLAALTGAAVTDPSLKQVWLYDPTLNQYNVLTLAGLGDALYLLSSTSSVTIGTGTQTFSVQANKDIAVGSWLLVVSNASPATNFMVGQVTSYVGQTLQLTVTYAQGTGAHTDWTMRVSSPPGAPGKSAGYSYAWLTSTTSADPGAGNIKGNNATFASITSLYISETDADGNALATEIASWVSGSSAIKGRLKVYDPLVPANFMTFDVTALADNGAWDTLTVAPVANGGSFTASEGLRVAFTPKGDKGDTGAPGAPGSGSVSGGTAGALAVFSGATSIGSSAVVGKDYNPFGAILNGSLTWTVSGNALTIALKTRAGADPSASDPVYAFVRSVTATDGLPALMTITAALSLVISSGSTMGASNSTAFRLWAVLFNDAGTPRIGAINCLNGVDIYPLAGWHIASSTAEGGAGAADNAHTFYTGAAVASKPYSVLGYANWETGLTAAGTWASAPTRAQAFGPGVPLPGQMLQEKEDVTITPSSGTTVLPNDNTTPQNTEGDQYHSKAITPLSAANILAIEHTGYGTHSTSPLIIEALFQDANANAIASAGTSLAAAIIQAVGLKHRMLAGTTVATTFKLRAGANAGATYYYLQTPSVTPSWGSTLAGRLNIKEIMA